jgi:uncharacterized protein (DUF697 family)/predicted GTPase
MFTAIKKMFSSGDAELHERLERLVKKTPIPAFWLFGKTQSGKTSLIKFLTGAEDAEIGQGFKPCTRFSREYRFPTAEAPLLIFLDTRGLEEPGYDAAEDLARFDTQAHVMIVTIRLLDFATAKVVQQLHAIRERQPTRPVILALTCLHDAYPQKQHRDPYPFRADGDATADAAKDVPEDLVRSIAAQREQFRGLYDHLVPVDLTPALEGFHDPAYGGARLKEVLIGALPEAYRETLLKLEEATRTLQSYYERRALPHIVGFSTLAASAGAVPIPWVDLLVLPGIQTQMVFDLARLYGQPLTGPRFMELASTLGLGMLMRQGIREFAKFIPVVGSLAGAALAGSATFALGKAFCYYYAAVHRGHVPKAPELKRYYSEQLAQAARLWGAS